MADEKHGIPLTGEEIVISGISGNYPSSDNTQQFMENLYNKVDMVESSESYWNFDHPGVPKYVGRTRRMEYFDASFFKVPRGQSEVIDAMNRKLLELTFCALFDAGVNPMTLAGKNVGVFVGSSFADMFAINMYNQSIHSKYVVTGASKAMLANRISYWLDIKGPSYTLDSSCSSSTTGLTNAYKSIRNGYCDAAIVAGCNHCQHPVLSVNMLRAGYLCADGKTKCFDKHGDGYVRSEASSVVFLQKRKHAKRIYTEIYYAEEKYFAKPDAFSQTARDSDDVVAFLEEFYKKAGVSPSDVEYVEANATGLADADAAELEAIGRVFAKDKTIMVGSVKSNMGHAECASGVCSLSKMCLAYQKGQIAGNLYYSEPQDISAVKEGRIQVLTENTPFNRSFTALNTFSYTGMNYHVLMKGHYKPKDFTKYSSSIPRLVVASGRTESCVQQIIDLLKNSPVDPEQVALVHDFFKLNITAHLARGYAIIDSDVNNETKCLAESTSYLSGEKCPVWFLYSGMGSQWAGMGADLMRIPTFAAAIEKCHQVLQPKGIDVYDMITNPDDKNLDYILNSFVGIIAIQIGLTDVLKELGIVPDNIIGHSLGELSCAYADGSLTAEETILSSYYRGIVSIETKFIRGLMAAVKLGHKEVKSICPPEIETACHNNSQSTTISGPEDIVSSFIKDLKDRGIFAKEVPTSNIAYHSSYIAHAGPKLLSDMIKVIKSPKLRSEKWISTSMPPAESQSPAADKYKYASAEYFTNNLLNQVYFEEAAENIPKNAIVIEIAPHGLMQPIVRNSLKHCNHVSLTKRGHENSVNFLLESIGKLYQYGLNPHLDVLYPKVQYPVSTETPLLSHFIGWEHSDKWALAVFKKPNMVIMAAREVALSKQDEDWKFLDGNFRNGINVFPESALLVLVWETLVMYKGINYKNMPVKFELVRFHQEVALNDDEVIKLKITIQKGTNNFEVTCEDSLIASGMVQIVNKMYNIIPDTTYDAHDKNTLDKHHIYSLLSSKGYLYNNDFQVIEKLNLQENRALLKSTGDIVTFLDSFIQLHILANNYDGVSVLKFIGKLSVNFRDVQRDVLPNIDIDKRIYVSTRGGGVNLENVLFKDELSQNFGLNLGNLIVTKANEHEDIKIAYIGLPRSEYLEKGSKITDAIIDFSGLKTNGERIMGLCLGSIDNSIEPDSELLWPIQNNWTLEDAATVILPYIHAYYCLVVRGNLLVKRCLLMSEGKRKQNVLITNGEDAFGHAAIAVCLAANCVVYTIVSSEAKKELLLNLYPELQDENIITSTDECFHFKLAQITENELCDIVMNDMTGTFREHALKCVGPSGFFLDTSSHDMKQNSDFGMHYLVQAKNYVAVQLPTLFKQQNLKERQLIKELVSKYIAEGIIKPFGRRVYNANEVNGAFEAGVSDKHAERILLKMNANEMNNAENVSQNRIDGKFVSLDRLFIHEKKSTRTTITGLAAFYSYIDKDEWEATNPLVLMPTLLNRISIEGLGEIHPDEPVLIMIPGFEGHSQVFKSVCERVIIHAVTMQMGPNIFEGSVSEMANTILSHIKPNYNLKSKFYLLGYSFGVNVALELAALVEKEGHVGVVYCLDSSPDVLKLQINAYLGDLSDDELQNSIIKHMYKLMSEGNSDELDKDLVRIKNWSDKVNFCLKTIRDKVRFSNDYIKSILNSAYQRILLAKGYLPEMKLKSEIVLMKGISHPRMCNIPKDYYLSKYAEKPVKVFDIEADHVLVPQHNSVPNIVNKMLDHELIEQFKLKNLCERYEYKI